MLKFFSLFPLLFAYPQLVSAATYNLEDLKALAQEKSYNEFLTHAMDIRPSLRRDEWKTMVLEMGQIYVKELLSANTVDKNDFKKIENIYGWAPLREDELFSARRHELGLKYLRKCISDNKPCFEELKSFWEQDKSNPETAYRLAELTKPYQHSPITQWDFLKHAVKSNLSEFYCKKEFVQKEIWTQLENIYIKLGNGDLLKQIDTLLHPECLGPLNQLALKKMSAPDKGSDRELSFQILKAQFKATTKIEDLFYTIYLLERPSQGELFNYAWNRVKLLASLPSRRDAVIETFKTLDPIPDEVFSSLDELKISAIYKHMNENFPEIIDYYFKQCKAYYSGTKTFLNGNPTLHCKDFIESSPAATVLDPSLIKEFKAIFKFKK